MNATAKKILAIGLVVMVPLTYVCMPVLIGIMAGCATTEEVAPPLPPVPDFSAGLYSFPKFQLPGARPPGSVDLAVISVIPKYKDEQSGLASTGDKLASLEPQRGSLTKGMSKVLQSFSNSVGEDLQGLLVAKGMTALGPIDIDEVTFPQKKSSSLTVLMEFVFDVQYSQIKPFQENGVYAGGVHAETYTGTMTVGLKVYYYLLEPLSEEKMWVKKLDLGSDDYSFVVGKKLEQYQSGTNQVSDGCGDVSNVPVYAWRDTGETLFDSRAQVFSRVLQKAYPQLMETAAKYFDADEMLSLRAKAQEIRARWGSSSFRRGESP